MFTMRKILLGASFLFVSNAMLATDLDMKKITSINSIGKWFAPADNSFVI